MSHMSKRDVLLEIGLEEMPARYITDAMEQLGDKVTQWFAAKNISYEKVELYSTPRRLAVIITNVDEKQADIHEEAKGPSKKIALDEAGNWTKAALGFARGQGVTVDELYVKEINGVEYVFAEKHISGQDTFSILPELQDIITSIHFPKNMRWASYDLKYIRPIHWICALYGEEIIPMQILNVTSSNVTEGHRFLGKQITIPTPAQYKQLLEEQFVIVDPKVRKSSILTQLQQLEEKNNWIIPVDEDLLEEVNNLVEYPTALSGTFETSFLQIPDEVLITSMKEHQRYFPVKNEAGQLLPYFVTFRNGNDEHLENVAKGNEKVLRARLADAQFFYEEDQKSSIAESCEKLNKIVFHEELGTTGEKVKRIVMLAGKLADKLQLSHADKEKIIRAATICKFDLVTNMVNEFPELQGIMGEKYAVIFGEDPEVAKAINEHYMPRSADDSVAETKIGAIVGIADKLDTIISFFGIGLIPTGSQDPYALRRQAQGIVQTLLAHQMELSLADIIDLGLAENAGQNLLKHDKEKVKEDVLAFFKLRLKNVLQEEQVRYDVIDAVLANNIGNVNEIVLKAKFIMEQLESDSFKQTVEALSRVTNIADKATSAQYDVALFQAKEEEQLHNAYVAIKDDVIQQIQSLQFAEAFRQLASLTEAINNYFEHIMVMVDDETVRDNRLGHLAAISQLIHQFARFTAIVFK